MGLESATFIHQLDVNNPVGNLDTKAQGDDHIRLIKAAIKNTFPNIQGAVNISHGDFNGFFAQGNKMLWQQSTAPTGWTKDTSRDNSALRVVSGLVQNGGSDNFTTVFGSGKTTAGHALTTAQMPSHTHNGVTGGAGAHSHLQRLGVSGGPSSNIGHSGFTGARSDVAADGVVFTAPVSSHSHSFGTSATGGGQAHSHGLTLNLKYTDVIIAVRN
jgi:hypothetical protein